MKIKNTGLYLSLIILASNASAQFHNHTNRVTSTNFDNLHLSKNFKIGVGDSAFQTEGQQGPSGKICRNNWTELQNKKDETGNYYIKDNQKIGNGCNRWDLYKEDIALIAQSGFDIYRTSIEWSKVEPELGIFDEAAMDHYEAVCDEAIAQGLEPIITLFHHTWPTWFESLGDDENGYGFENKESIKQFLDYCSYVFNRLHKKVKKWIILNEPAGYAIQGWWRGQYPPVKKSLKLAGIVLNNMLDAHVDAYLMFKKIDKNAEVGIAKIFQPIDPYHPWNPLELAACKFSNHLMNNATLEYFKTGKFTWGYIGNSMSTYNRKAPQSLDFLGINYYTHTVLSGNWDLKKIIEPTHLPQEKVSDDGKSMYPEGLMRAIKQGSKLNIPMYIMENGVADKNDRIREEYIYKHLETTIKAAEKYDIRGYFYWTGMDNFEWRQGYSQAYGLYGCNHGTQERTLRSSSQAFIDFLNKRKK